MSRSILLLSALALMACGGPIYKYTLNAEAPMPSRAPNCNFRVVNVAPEKGYAELGTIDRVEHHIVHDQAEFKLQVTAIVCQAGGNLVVPQINGWGDYVRAVVFAKVPDKSVAAAQ